MEKEIANLPRRQVLKAAAITGGLPLLESAHSALAANSPATSMSATSGPVRVAVLDDFMGVGAKADWSVLKGRASVDFYHDHFYDQAALARQMAPYDIIAMARHGQIFTANTISKLPKLKLVVNIGGLTDQLDMAQCQKQNILISIGGGGGGGAPAGGPPGGVEEVAFALLIDLARQISFHNADMHANRHWQFRPSPSFAGKTLGLVGLGVQGTKMAQFAKAFRVKTVAWSTNMTDAQATAGGSTRVELKDLMAQSDFVSIHYRFSDRSRNLIRGEHLALMKPTAYLINTSRGPIVNEPDLIAALQQKRIAGAGLDVFDVEPLPANHPFRKMDNVVLTPHIGYVTVEYLANAYRQTLEDIVAYLDGKPIRVQPWDTVNID